MAPTPRPVPVTIVAGWHGAGRSSVVRAALDQLDPARTAVIRGGFHLEQAPDRDLVVIDVDEEVGHRSPGCPCCALRTDLVEVLDDLLTTRRPPERVLVELAGGSDPVVAAQTILDHPRLRRRAEVERIVTVVDGAAAAVRMAEGADPLGSRDLLDPVLAADLVVVTKLDQLLDRAAEQVGWTVYGIQPWARVEVGGAHSAGHHLARPLRSFATETIEGHLDRLAPHPSRHGGHVVRLDLPGVVDPDRFEAWLDGVHEQCGPDLLRFHVRLAVDGSPVAHWAMRGVRTTVVADEVDPPAPDPGSGPCNRVLLVGHDLDRSELASGLSECLVTR